MNSKLMLFRGVIQQLTSGSTGQITAVTFCAKIRTKAAISPKPQMQALEGIKWIFGTH